MPHLNAQKNKDVLVVYFSDTSILEESKVKAIGKELEETRRRAGQGKMLLNFDGVEYMTSAMLGCLVLCVKKCKAEKIKLKFSNISKNISEIFTLVRLDKLVDMYASEEKAIAAFEKSGWLIK